MNQCFNGIRCSLLEILSILNEICRIVNITVFDVDVNQGSSHGSSKIRECCLLHQNINIGVVGLIHTANMNFMADVAPSG